MELRDFLQLFVYRWRLMSGVFILAIMAGAVGYRLQPHFYRGELLLSVARQGSGTISSEYRYDQSYRLQADERIGEMVARYLGTETGIHEVARRSSLSLQQEMAFRESDVSALHLSTGLVKIVYHAETPAAAERIADGFLEAAEQQVSGLNERSAERDWFTLVSTEPVVSDGRFSILFALGIAALAGVFFGFWAVLGLWYWNGSSYRR